MVFLNICSIRCRVWENYIIFEIDLRLLHMGYKTLKFKAILLTILFWLLASISAICLIFIIVAVCEKDGQAIAITLFVIFAGLAIWVKISEKKAKTEVSDFFISRNPSHEIPPAFDYSEHIGYPENISNESDDEAIYLHEDENKICAIDLDEVEIIDPLISSFTNQSSIAGPFASNYAYESMVSAFNNLNKSKKLWMVTEEEDISSERGRANRSVIRKEFSSLSKGLYNGHHQNTKAPILPTIHKGKVYLYKDFVLVVEKRKKVKLSYNELSLELHNVEFEVNDGSKLPKDSAIIGMTYKYRNMDGSKDHRYRDDENEEYPLIAVGELISESCGIDIMLSNQKLTQDFFEAFEKYRKLQ